MTVPVELAELAAGLPAAASFAIAGGITVVREGRRRSALNEAVHELRRPLQALSLAVRGGAGGDGPFESSLQLAAMALERLDHEINGSSSQVDAGAVEIKALVEAAVERWQPRASLAGKSLSLRWRASALVLDGRECELAQALDNLITNAIEHGGQRIVVEAVERGDRLLLSVLDSGAKTGPRSASANGFAARVGGRCRHGHGLRVVARVAAAHRGRFRLLRDGAITRAVLDLPLGWVSAR